MIIHTLAVIPNEEVVRYPPPLSFISPLSLQVCRERIDAICAHFTAGEAGKILETELKSIEVGEVPTGREAVPIITQVYGSIIE